MHPETYLPLHHARERELLSPVRRSPVTARARTSGPTATAVAQRWAALRASVAPTDDLCCAAA